LHDGPGSPGLPPHWSASARRRPRPLPLPRCRRRLRVDGLPGGPRPGKPSGSVWPRRKTTPQVGVPAEPGRSFAGRGSKSGRPSACRPDRVSLSPVSHAGVTPKHTGAPAPRRERGRLLPGPRPPENL